MNPVLSNDDIRAAIEAYRLCSTRYGDAIALDLAAEALIARHRDMAKETACEQAALLVRLEQDTGLWRPVIRLPARCGSVRAGTA